MRFHIFRIFISFLFTTSFIVTNPGFLYGQGLLPESLPTVRWEQAGVKDSIPSYEQIINIVEAGADPSGVSSNSVILAQLIQEYSGTETVIFFPAGDYLFSEPVTIRDQIILRGAGQGSTNLIFNLQGQNQNAISVLGTISNETYQVQNNISANSHEISVANLELPLNESVWAFLQFNDSTLMASSWAYRTAGGLYELSAQGGNEYLSGEAFRRTISIEESPQVRLMTPVSGVGIECLSISRMDATPQQTSNVVFDAAVDCWVIGVESHFCNFAHVDVRRSANLTIRGNYFHEAHAYGGGGQGYGVVLQYGSTLCKVDNNIFRKLRHSMLLQAGAQANVLAYNYSRETFWTQGNLPAESAGDLVLHGNYPYLNLFEGNIVQNIVIDASHGQNGPHNYFLRNRAELYGIVMSQGSGTDSTHFIGNEVISNMFLQGFYSLIGRGNFEYGNRVRGTIRPQGTIGDFPESLYLVDQPGFWESDTWPHIGIDDLALSAINPAKVRYDMSEYTDCRTHPVPATTSLGEEILHDNAIKVFPNPATNEIFLEYNHLDPVNGLIYSISGQLMKSTDWISADRSVDVSSLPVGTYVLILIDQNSFYQRAIFIKQ